MDLKAWRERQQQGEAYTLPSGLEIKLKRIGILDLAIKGNVPDEMQELVDQVVRGNVPRLTMDKLPEFTDLVDLVVAQAVIEPPLTEKADDEHLGIEELVIADKLAVFNWANQVTVSVKPTS